ncbi:MAG: 1-acyl-sn-glycerol-3-phosphate acyltransferase [Chitinivibrionia bacterium]|nr:1-acyl-sn-glycerol-3-phosphate acyltransferase [Chitinivibrionia bacterium]
MFGILKSLFILLAYIFTGGIFLLFAVPVSLLFLPFGKHKKVFSAQLSKYMKWAVSDALKFFGVLEITQITGLENIRKNAILISNHQSFFDGFIVMGHIPSIPLIKSSYKFNPLFTWVALLFDFVSLKPTTKGVAEADKKIRKLIERGETICVFPEGTRSLDGKIKKFQSLAFKIAKDTDTAILPLVIHYSKPIMSKSGESFKFSEKVDVKISILPAICPKDFETTGRLLTKSQETVEKSYQQLRQ